MTKTLLNDCFLHDRDRLLHRDALALLKARLVPVVGQEDVATGDASGRVLASSVVAGRPVPAHANSAVDGYAFCYRDYDASAGGDFHIAGRSAAGHPFDGELDCNDAVRILTGAVMPDGCDSVVMQEDVTQSSDGLSINMPSGLKLGANRRDAGEDAAENSVVATAGSRLRPPDLAAIASTGAGHIRCYQQLRVAIISSGDEIIPAGVPLQPGQVYDANRPMLSSLITATGAHVTDLGTMADNEDVVLRTLREASLDHDLVITSGGASLGDEDYMVRALDQLGQRHLWQIAVKPGRPMTFGQIGNCVMLGLPGNPVAVFVCFLLYGRPVIEQLSGATWREPRRYKLPAGFTVPRKKPDRREFWRASLRQAGDTLVVDKFPRDGSGLISSIRDADGLIEVGESVTSVHEGDLVDFIPYTEFGLSAR